MSDVSVEEKERGEGLDCIPVDEDDDGVLHITLDARRKTYRAFRPVALHLDERFIMEFGVDKEVETQWDEVKNLEKQLIAVIKLLDRAIGDEAIDLCIALIARFLFESIDIGENPSLELSQWSPERKKEALQQFHELYADMEIPSDEVLLRMILGPQKFACLSKRYNGDCGAIMKRLWAACGRSDRLQNRLFVLLTQWLIGPERLLLSASVRQGWVHLLRAAEVSPDVRAKRVKNLLEETRQTLHAKMVAIDILDRKQWETLDDKDGEARVDFQDGLFIEQVAEERDECGGDTDALTREIRELQEQIMAQDCAFRAYALSNFQHPVSHPLTENIDWLSWRKRIDSAMKENDALRMSVLYRQLGSVVFDAVLSYTFREDFSQKSTLQRETHGIPSYVKGSPVHVVKEKDVSCFSGVWLMAALLAKCGIPLSHMRFTLVNQHYSGLIGSHGQLWLITPWNDILIFDPSYHFCGKEFVLPICASDHTIEALQKLISGASREPVNVRVLSDFSEAFDYPRSMIVMPVMDGIASLHLLNVGIAFFHEGKLEEAQRAFQSSFRFCMKNPDALYYLGLVRAQRGGIENARILFHDALNFFPEHVRSLHALGKLALMEGKHAEALVWFARVTKIPRDRIWGDTAFWSEAKVYMQEHGEEKDESVLTYSI